MKENRYDDQDFFEKYSHMSRSEKGLAGAGEWPVLQAMLPDFTNKPSGSGLRLWLALPICDGKRRGFSFGNGSFREDAGSGPHDQSAGRN